MKALETRSALRLKKYLNDPEIHTKLKSEFIKAPNEHIDMLKASITKIDSLRDSLKEIGLFDEEYENFSNFTKAELKQLLEYIEAML